jgi:lipoprotein-anchoring transpeptidase ErfK/SrfK
MSNRFLVPWRRLRRWAVANPLATAAALVIVVAVGFGVSRAHRDDTASPTTTAADARQAITGLVKALPDVGPPPAAPAPATPAADDANPPAFDIAHARPGARIAVRERPGGPVVAVLGARTEFDSNRTFYVAKRRGEWLGVTTAARLDNQLGWVRDDPSRLYITHSLYSLRADLSARVIQVRYGRRVVKRIPVTIGRAGSETPPGVFSVTDGLAGRGLGPYYGCCVLALTGHQPDLPAGWIGGDRIAIHGTPGPVGGASSAGCLRASDDDMVALFALVPLGTPVFIHA